MSRVLPLCGVKSVVVRRQKRRSSTNLVKVVPTIRLLVFQSRGIPSGNHETKRRMKNKQKSRIVEVTALLPTNAKSGLWTMRKSKTMTILPKATLRWMLLPLPRRRGLLKFQSSRHGRPRQCKTMRMLRISSIVLVVKGKSQSVLRMQVEARLVWNLVVALQSVMERSRHDLSERKASMKIP